MPTEPATKKPVNFVRNRGLRGSEIGARYVIRGMWKAGASQAKPGAYGSAVAARSLGGSDGRGLRKDGVTAQATFREGG